MRFEIFKKLFTTLRKEKEVRDNFINSVPISLQEAVFDNEFAESYCREVNALMTALFPDKLLLDDVDYFLFETSYPWVITVGENSEREYKIYNEQEMLNYFQAEYIWS